MATNFPTSLDSLTNPNSTDQLNSPSHAQQHANVNDAIEALEAKVGISGSSVTTSHDYKIAQLEAAITAGVSGTKLIYQDVRNQSGVSLAKGTPVRVTGSDGASGKLLVGAASNANEAGSSKTFGLVSSTINNNSNGQVVTNGLLEGVDTTGAVDGDPVWLGVDGAKIFGLANKPVAPAHLVYLGVVVRGGQQNTGSIFVSIQNGFEVEELHNVLISSLADKNALVYDSTTQLWKNYDLSQDFVSSSDVQNSLGDYVPLNTLGQPSGPAELDPNGNLLVPENSIIFEGATADANELTLLAPDVTSDITVTLPNASGTLAITSDIPSLTGYATENYVSTAISNLVDTAPTTLDTLNELAAALGDDPNYATTITTALGNKVSKAGGDTITASSASVKPLVLKGTTSQTANLFEIQNSLTSNLFSVSSSGRIISAGNIESTQSIKLGDTGGTFPAKLNIIIGSASIIGATIKAAASQTANLLEFQNSSGTPITFFNSSGGLTATEGVISTAYSGGKMTTGTLGYLNATTFNAAVSPVVVRGTTSQSADLTQWQNSAGTVLAKIYNSGAAQFQTTQSTKLDVGDYANSLAGNYINVKGASASTIGIIVQGASSQTANLQEWQNSAGTVLAKVDSTGAMFTVTPAVGTDTTQVATTAFVIDQIDASTQPGALYQTTAPTSPEIGQIWIDSDENVTTFDSNIIRRKTVTATAGQTVFTTDVPFVDGFEQVFMNGLLLVKTTDYATSNSNTVTLTSGAAVSDIIEIVTVTGANSVSTYTQAETDALLAANTSVAPLSISANTTLVAKKRYFVTSASALTLTLPATPALNDEIQILDASGNASTYNITVARNGNKINGGTGNLIIDNNGGWYTLLYTGSTYGWKVG
jgi:hypothetical protein